MTNKILIKEKTIVIPIGITNCGKSYFFEKYFIPVLKGYKINVKYLSSDQIRRDLLGNESEHKHSTRALQVSNQAFSILENSLDNFTQYPVNCDVVIVDAMNIVKESRQFIFDIAKKNNYKVVGLLFDYKKREDYFQYTEELNINKKIIADRLKYFKETTLRELKRNDFDGFYTISSNNFDSYNFIYEMATQFDQPDMNQFEKYCAIGDVHGCLDELIEAVTDEKGLTYDKKTGLLNITDQSKYHHHILVGDYVDKGPKKKETIKFLYENRQFFWIVRGNHESFVYKFLKGELGSFETNENIIRKFFDTILDIQHDEEYKKMFFELYESSYDFIKSENFIITHSPCESKFLSKHDNKSLKAQRNFVYPRSSEFATHEEFIVAKEEAFNFLLNEANSNYPIHIFGHVNVLEPFRYKNKFNIDTGCVNGNKLTALLFTINQKNPFIKTYKSKQVAGESLNLMFSLKRKDIVFSSLDHEIRKRLEYAAENKLNFISGTMSPTEKDMPSNELESLKKGIEYYQNMGVEKIILQPKFMGSRGNLLLHVNNIDKCKLFSRQGFQVKQERFKNEKYDLNNIYDSLQKKYSNLFKELNAKYILFDGEILPWIAMGKGLIEQDFIIPAKAVESELQLLKTNGFYEALETFNEKYKSANLDELKPHELKHINALKEFKKEIQSSDVIENNLTKYNQQLNFFAADGDLCYKPFSILKVIKVDGIEENWISETKSNIDIFDKISDECYLAIDLKTFTCTLRDFALDSTNPKNIFQGSNYEEVLISINQFWAYITEQKHMEGVVIKPDQVFKTGIAPYLKCRNTEYLKLVYGMDYDSLVHKRDSLIQTKGTKTKMSVSIKEWLLGKKLLDIKRKDISVNNPEWVSLAYQLITEQEQEKTLDPRL